MWPWCFVLDTTQGHDFPYFHYLGDELAVYSGVFLTGRTDWTQTLLDMAVKDYGRVLDFGEPVLNEDGLTRFDGAKLLFRSVLLPLSDNQESVNYILGAANGKVVPVGEEEVAEREVAGV